MLYFMSITLICIVCLKLWKKKILYENICWVDSFLQEQETLET